MKSFQAPIGITDFSQLRKVNSEGDSLNFVDKTRFLPELLKSDEMVSVVTRPALFMKTSILSMMEKFLSVKDAESNRELFSGLNIDNESYAEFREQNQGKVPVVKISLGALARAENSVAAMRSITNIIADLYEDYSFITPSLTERQQEKYNRIMNAKGERGELEEALSDLTKYLFKHYGRKAVVLIDDYDKPLYTAYHNTRKQDLTSSDSYFQIMNTFFSDFYSLAFRDNSSVEKAFITGLFCVKYSTAESPNNNFNFHSFLSPRFAEVFGLAEAEIDMLLGQVPSVINDNKEYYKKFSGGKADKLTCAKEAISYAYGGYVFGENPIKMHSPYSVMKYLQHLSEGGDLSPYDYCAEFPDRGNLFEHMSPRYKYLSKELCEIMLGENVDLDIKDAINFIELADEDEYDSFWSIFMHMGCFKIAKAQNQGGKFECVVANANNESKGIFSRLVNRCINEVVFAKKPSLLDIALGSSEEFGRRLKERHSSSFASSSSAFSPPSKRNSDDAELDEHASSSMQRSL